MHQNFACCVRKFSKFAKFYVFLDFRSHFLKKTTPDTKLLNFIISKGPIALSENAKVCCLKSCLFEKICPKVKTIFLKSGFKGHYLKPHLVPKCQNHFFQ